jgi:BirA family biotin operon repressor/biotin-[acetyl-CoA-carboxylase] ligase
MNFMQIPPIRLEEIDSTNAEAFRMLKAGKPQEGTCITARYQHSGRGQRSNQWLSHPNENLLASFILYPPPHAADNPFLLSKTMALAVHDTIRSFTTLDAEIKWPNDILVRKKKIAGILMENQWQGSVWHAAVIGIGINVNQQKFEIEHATSLAIESKEPVILDNVLASLQNNLSNRYSQFCKRENSAIIENYQDHLFGRDEFYPYETDQGIIMGKVLQVLNDGHLQLEQPNGHRNAYSLNELRLIY